MVCSAGGAASLQEKPNTSITWSGIKESKVHLRTNSGLQRMWKNEMAEKLDIIMNSSAHILYGNFSKSTFRLWLILPRCSKKHYWKSFLPAAITLHNTSSQWNTPPASQNEWKIGQNSFMYIQSVSSVTCCCITDVCVCYLLILYVLNV